MLEEKVDEKFYIKENYTIELLKNVMKKEISKTIRCGGRCSLDTKHEWDLVVGSPRIVAQRGRYNEEEKIVQQLEIQNNDLTNTITTVQKDNMVLEPKLDFIGGIGNPNRLDNGKQLSRNFKEGYRVYNSEGLACTQKSNGGGLGGCSGLYLCDYRVRKLTPKECWRLMGWKDEQFNKAEKVSSNSQLYKMAGNGIVINVLEGIFSKLVEFGYIK